MINRSALLNLFAHWRLDWLLVIVVALLKFAYFDATFFSDAIACLARPALLIYDNGMDYFVYERLYDNGDPHVLPWILAWTWRLFGLSMPVAHALFALFAVCGAWQLLRLCRLVLADMPRGFDTFVASAVVFADTSFLAKMMGLSADAVLVTFGLLAINSLLSKNRLWLTIALVGLLVTRRGMLVSATVMTCCLIFHLVENKGSVSLPGLWRNVVLPCLPACLLVGVYVIVRIELRGWFFTNDYSVWAGTGDVVGPLGLLRNAIVWLRWNWDYGRFAVWGAAIVMALIGAKRLRSDAILRKLGCVYLSLVIVFALVTIPLANPFGPRYFILQFLVLALIAIRAMMLLLTGAVLRSSLLAVLAILISGSHWVYPEKLSQAWDCTLKLHDFFELRANCLNGIDSRGIDFSRVASGFGIYGDQRMIDLSQSRTIGCDAEACDYYIYSNVTNESDETIDYLKDNFVVLQEYRSAGVFVTLLKRND